MAFLVIGNPDARRHSGFRPGEFRKLAGLFSRGASVQALYDMAVDVDMDEGVCTITYYRSNSYRACLQFIVRHVGPHTDMYELFQKGQGCVIRSPVFSRVFARLEKEVEALMGVQSRRD